MSANERDINLHAESHLGEEGLPSYDEVVTGDKHFKEGKGLASSSETAERDNHIVPSYNKNNIIPHPNNNLNAESGESSNELHCVTNSDESKIRNINNITNSLQQKESTTYVVSNTRSCTLRLKSAGFTEKGSKKNKVTESSKNITHNELEIKNLHIIDISRNIVWYFEIIQFINLRRKNKKSNIVLIPYNLIEKKLREQQPDLHQRFLHLLRR